MSRLVALFTFATVLFAFAPRPTGVITDAPTETAPPSDDEVPDLSDRKLELDVPVWPYHDFCMPEMDRLEKQTLDEAQTADHIGPPPLISDWKEYQKPPPEPTYPSRSPWRAPRLRGTGANDASERAIAMSLAWLARHQKQDGGWEFDGTEKADRAAATGFALLTYLRVAFTHKPNRLYEENKYQKTVAAGFWFLMKSCQLSGPSAGKFDNSSMAGQAIATLALCEAYGMTEDPVIKPYAQAALNYLHKARGPNGGWGERVGDHGDIFTTGWVMQALHAAQRTKELVVDERVIKGAMKFLDSVSAGSRRSMFGTTDNTDAKFGTTATAIGLWCRYHFGSWGPEHAGMIEGVAGLVKNPPSEENRDPLYLYYGSWVMARFEGEDWKNWNEGLKTTEGVRKGGMRDLLVSLQFRKADDPTKHGSWDAAGDWGKRYGRLGTTALNLLTLEVYYRTVPLYKRDANKSGTQIEDRK